MFCIKCGVAMEDNARYCIACGTPAGGANQSGEMVLTPESRQEAADGITPTSIMVLGIVAAALCRFGVPGIILGAIGRNKVNKYLSAGGVITSKVKVGSILSKVGLFAGIAMTVFWIFFFMIYILLIMLLAGAMAAVAYYG